MIKSSQFAITVAFCNKTVIYCNKKPDTFCNKLLSHFVIKQLSYFVINCHNESNMNRKHYWHPKSDFRCSFYAQCPLVLCLYWAKGREGGFFSLSLNTYSKTARIFCLKREPCQQNFFGTLWHTQVWNLKYISLTIVLFFFNFLLLILQFFLYSTDYLIKRKYILLELKLPWPVRAVSETYNRDRNFLELVDVLPNVSFTTSEAKRNYY